MCIPLDPPTILACYKATVRIDIELLKQIRTEVTCFHHDHIALFCSRRIRQLEQNLRDLEQPVPTDFPAGNP